MEMTEEKLKSTQIAIRVNHQELKRIIKKFFRKRRALFIWGPVGIGKSDIVREVARELAEDKGLIYTENIEHINDEKYFVLLDIRLSQMDPSDLRGIPCWDKEAGVTRWLPPSTFPKKGNGFFFFDELNLAPNLTQASSYQLILRRCLGEYQVPEGYGVIAAGNRLEDKAHVFDMSFPLANRQGHVELVPPTVELWTQWASKHKIDARIVGFLNWRQGLLYNVNPNFKEKAQPTPRTWEFGSDLIEDIPSKHLEELKLFLATVVGEGPAIEFIAFLRKRENLLPIEEYFKKPTSVKLPDTNEVDLQWALSTALVEYYRAHMDKKHLIALLKLLKRVSEEYATFILKLINAFDESLQDKLEKIPEAAELADKLWKFLA